MIARIIEFSVRNRWMVIIAWIGIAIWGLYAVLHTPVIDHIGSHAMALFELAALHIEREAATGGEEKADLAEASLAIDAMAALVEGLGDRLNPYRGQLESALNQLRMAFVQLN